MPSRLAKFSATCRVGRLVEARLEWLNDASDVAEFQQSMNSAFQRAGAGAIVCANWSALGVLPPVAGDALVELLRRGNSRLERSAVLLPSSNAILSLQVERMFREAGPEAPRRAFRQADLALSWIGEVLQPAELESARELLFS